MAYLIGIDEAGYGPNLGPLVIGATVWEIPESSWEDLFERLAPGIARPKDRSSATWLTVGDSKALYSPQKGLTALELAVQALLAQSSQQLENDYDLIESLALNPWPASSVPPWYTTPHRTLPVDPPADPNLGRALSKRLADDLNQSGIRFHRAANRILEPEVYNQRCREAGNKATVLSEESIALLGQVIDDLPASPQPIYCQCDRHGGRTHYGSLLQSRFTDFFVENHGESAKQSVYRWGPDHRRVEVRFSPGGERHWEVAWASMMAKYLRELAMNRFNHFWQAHDQDLKSTRGYPVDAKRFRQDIEATRERLQISEDLFWRER